MTPTLVIPARNPEPITDDFLREILNPTEPDVRRMVTSFHLTMVLHHALILIEEGEHTSITWQADLRSSLAAIAEVLGEQRLA